MKNFKAFFCSGDLQRDNFLSPLLEVWVGGRGSGTRIEVDGAILVWGAITPKGRAEVIK